MNRSEREVMASLAATVDQLAALHPSNPADTRRLFRYAAIRTPVLRAVHLALSTMAFGDPDGSASDWADDAARDLKAALDAIDLDGPMIGRND